jgi:hypothetical protein
MRDRIKFSRRASKKKTMKLVAFTALLSATLLAAPSTGPEIGTKAPAFEGRDQNGVTHTLASVLGPKGAIVVFYRSADW